MSNPSPVRSVIVFNGPPGCGKDFVAATMKEIMTDMGTTVHHNEVKNRLINLTCLIHDISREEWDQSYHHPTKDMPHIKLGGLTMRQALIHVSETVIKPNFGQNYFGRAAGKSLKDGVNLFSDGGFEPEIREIMNAVGRDNFLLVRIHPLVDGELKGFEGSGDSRGYVMCDDIPSVDVTNDYTESFVDLVADSVAELMERHERRCVEADRSDLIIPVVHRLSKASADLATIDSGLQN